MQQATYDSDRRLFIRKRMCVPVQIDTIQRRERIGITLDLSRSGARLLSNSQFPVGERLLVTLGVNESRPDDPIVDGRVVRVEKTPPDVMWRYVMAVRFNEALPGEGSSLDLEAPAQA